MVHVHMYMYIAITHRSQCVLVPERLVSPRVHCHLLMVDLSFLSVVVSLQGRGLVPCLHTLHQLSKDGAGGRRGKEGGEDRGIQVHVLFYSGTPGHPWDSLKCPS